MSLLLVIVLIIIALNVAGGFVPTWRTNQYYVPSWGLLVFVLFVLWLTGHLHA